MAAEVTLSVRTQLLKIVEELDKINDKSREVSASLADAGKDVGETLSDQTRRTTTFLQDLAAIGSRVGSQLKEDFKALVSLNAITGSLKLSEQFRGSIKETVELSDMVRKLGSSFGVAEDQFESFQSFMTKGLGEIGASSEEAAKALESLSGTGIKGQENILAYAKAGTQLASLGRERGKGGEVTGLVAQIVRAQGKQLNVESMQQVAKAVTKAMEASGKTATEVLSGMKETFEHMSPEEQKKRTAGGVAQMSVAESVAGPGATSALKNFLKGGMIGQTRLEAQGFGKIFTKEGGLDVQGLKNFSKEMKRIPGDLKASLHTYGFTEEESEGLIRLMQRSDQLSDSLKDMEKASDDFSEKFKKNMGLSEAFAANLNKVKGIFAGPLSTATQGLTKVLAKASGSMGGAGAVVAGGGILAAVLAGAGLRGAGKALGVGGIAGIAKGAVGGAIAKQAGATPVYVVNASEIGGGGTADMASNAASLLGGAGKFVKGAGILGAAVELGTAGYNAYETATKENATTEEKGTSYGAAAGTAIGAIAGTFAGGPVGTAIGAAIGKEVGSYIGKYVGGQMTSPKPQKVIVELNKRELKESKPHGRGGSN